MLVFSSEGCGPCDALMPDLAVWQRQHAQQLAIGVIAAGDQDSNRAKAAEHGLALMLLQSKLEVADAYEAYGTPMAVVIDTDGRIASPTVGGSDAIGTLVAQATRTSLEVVQMPPSHGHRNGNGDAAREREISQLGERAPELVLSGLDGERVALRDLYAQRTIAIFWNPGCGFCQQMLPALKAFEDNRPAGSPRLAVISSGDTDSAREHELRSIVLLDPEGTAMGAFGGAEPRWLS